MDILHFLMNLEPLEACYLGETEFEGYNYYWAAWVAKKVKLMISNLQLQTQHNGLTKDHFSPTVEWLQIWNNFEPNEATQS